MHDSAQKADHRTHVNPEDGETAYARAMGGDEGHCRLHIRARKARYHIEANRNHFISVIEQIKADPIATPDGVPGVMAWMQEFEKVNKGGNPSNTADAEYFR